MKSFVNEFDWIVGMTCFRGEVGVSFLRGVINQCCTALAEQGI